MQTLRLLWKVWDMILALAIGIAGAVLPRPPLQDITTEVITFFAIQSAVILPAMIFTAGLLRGDGLSLAEARQYHKALRLQMRFWVTLLTLDFIAVCLLIFGKAVEWKLLLHLNVFHLQISVNFGVILIGSTCFIIALCVFRMIPFVKGVMSLQEMNGRLVEMSIAERERRRTEEAGSLQAKLLNLPPNYGQINKSH